MERGKPASLPSLKDALAGVVEVDGSDDGEQKQKEGVVHLPKIKRPPPVLDDNLWDEIKTEVKRKSMHEPATSVEEGDGVQQEGTTADLGNIVEQEDAEEESVDSLANQIKAQIGMYCTQLLQHMLSLFIV